MKKTTSLTRQELKDLRVLARFTGIYCRRHHAGDKAPLPDTDSSLSGLGLKRLLVCQECREFLHYAIEKRTRCPLDPKPTCKQCHIHCYRDGHREKVRQIMKFSGPYLIKRGRLDLLWHYLF